ncbi:MAG TPA: S9 family peptidase, partial [Gemmatimonadaceae bacterium]|nr:S9 family peptidase [Gemmatimonadaceae bacterium]
MRLHPVLATLAFAGALHAQGVIAPNDNLVVDGIPPVPARIAETARPYTESRAVTLWDWAPRAHAMLIGTRFGETVQAHAVAMAMGERRQLTFFPDRVQEAVYEPTAGRYLVVARDAGGNEFTQLYRFDLATGSATLITDGGRSQNGIGPWSRDGKRIAYASTRRDGTDRDLYVMDPADPGTDRLVAKVTGSWQPLDWSPDGTSLLAMQFVSVNESYLWLVDVATGAMTALTPKGAELVAYDRGAFAADGKGIYTVTDLGSDVARLAYLDLATKRVTPVTKASWDVEAFALSRDGRTIAYVTNEDGISKLHLMRAGTHAALPAPKVPVGVIGDLRWHPDGTLLGFTVNSARAPSDAYVLDVKRGSVARWTASETGGLDLSAMPEPELVRWKTWDGRMLSGFLYRPPARFTGKRPVIVNIHGGPEGQSRPVFIARNNYFVNELGVAMLYPNVRGSTGYGKAFVKLDNGVLREGTYRDIDALFDWIGAQPGLDAAHVMVTGGSYGGHMTLAVATNYSDRICCSVDVVGMSNLVTFLEHTESYRRDLRRAEYGDERDSATRAFMERTAPLNNAQRITKPMFIVAGYNDPRVPYTEAEQMVAALKKAGIPVWYLLGKNEGHGFAKKANADFQFYATVYFVEEFL